jgi:RNA polymerase sigma factor (TIGR02999 family)
MLNFRSPSIYGTRMDSGEGPAYITRLLQEWQNGSQDAFDRLVPLVYNELRALASRQLTREWRHDRLEITAVVTEAYLRLLDQREVDWKSRGHFFAIASQLMRRVLIDHARLRTREKRGGIQTPAELNEAVTVPDTHALDAVDVLDLDRALTKLEALDAAQARIIELRFFGGLTIEETAHALALSPTTVKREWAVARGWLYRELTRQAQASARRMGQSACN